MTSNRHESTQIIELKTKRCIKSVFQMEKISIKKSSIRNVLKLWVLFFGEYYRLRNDNRLIHIFRYIFFFPIKTDIYSRADVFLFKSLKYKA